jgi:hypothetical protein
MMAFHRTYRTDDDTIHTNDRVGFPASAALAQTGGGFDQTWSIIDGGGAMNARRHVQSPAPSASPFQMPPFMTGGSFELTGGFWSVSQVCFCLADMNGDFKKDGADVQQFAQCVLVGGNCSCADVDAAGGVTLDDLAVFVDDLVSGSMCP